MSVLNINELKQRWINGFTPNEEDYGDAFDALLAATNIVGSLYKKEYTDFTLSGGVFDLGLESGETLFAFQATIGQNKLQGFSLQLRAEPDPNNTGMYMATLIDVFKFDDPTQKLSYTGDLELFSLNQNQQIATVSVNFTGSEILLFDNLNIDPTVDATILIRGLSSPTINDGVNDFPLNPNTTPNQIQGEFVHNYDDVSNPVLNGGYIDDVNLDEVATGFNLAEDINQTDLDIGNLGGNELRSLNVFVFKATI